MVDASSGQSRADVVLIFMAAVLVLTGLQWLSLKQRDALAVEPDGPASAFYDASLQPAARAELEWCAESVGTGLARGLRVACRGGSEQGFNNGVLVSVCRGQTWRVS